MKRTYTTERRGDKFHEIIINEEDDGRVIQLKSAMAHDTEAAAQAYSATQRHFDEKVLMGYEYVLLGPDTPIEDYSEIVSPRSYRAEFINGVAQ